MAYRRVRWLWVALLLGASVWYWAVAEPIGTRPASRSAGQGVVHAVFFYSPTCPHCHEVLRKHLPPLLERYGDRLQIVQINTRTAIGATLYRAAVERFEIEEHRRGVPTLIVGAWVLVGSVEIPERLPLLVERGLEREGIPLADIPGLREVLAARSLELADADGRGAVPVAETANERSAGWPSQGPSALEEDIFERFARDPAGNTVAVVVLIGMVLSLVRIGHGLIQGSGEALPRWPPWTVPSLLVIGLGISAYLSFVEVREARAVCGPVGDCNTVQQSEYARLFGVVPMALLGLIAYAAMVVAKLVQGMGPKRWRRPAMLCLFGLALCGTLFSVYLTFLEPFVIGATCMWCILSALTMTSLLWASALPAREAWAQSARFEPG